MQPGSNTNKKSARIKKSYFPSRFLTIHLKCLCKENYLDFRKLSTIFQELGWTCKKPLEVLQNFQFAVDAISNYDFVSIT